MKVALLCLAAYWLSAGDVLISGDERERYEVTQALVSQGDLAISRTAQGAVYSKFGVLQSVLAIPAYGVGRACEYLLGQREIVLPAGHVPQPRSQRIAERVMVILWNPAITATTVAVLAALVRALGYSARTVAGTALLYGLGTMAWAYTKTFLSEPLSALALTGAALGTLRWRQTGASGWLIAAGTCWGVLIENAPVWIPFAAGWLVIIAGAASPARRLRIAEQAAAPVAIMLILMTFENLIRYGAWGNRGYPDPSKALFTTPILTGLYGLLVSSGKGVLWFNPILLVSLAAIPRFSAGRSHGVWLWAGALGAYVGIMATWENWYGGACWGPRFLVPLLPLLVLPLAAVLERPGWRAAVGIGALASVVVQVRAVVGHPGIVHPAIDTVLWTNEYLLWFVPSHSQLAVAWSYIWTGPRDLVWLNLLPQPAQMPVLALGAVAVGWCAVRQWRRG